MPPIRPLLRAKLGYIALALALLTSYLWFGSAGTMTDFPTLTSYYDLQADAFLQGQSDLLIKPAPELLKAENPYDSKNGPYWLWDAILYHGKYYLYWGPVPALMIAAAKTISSVALIPDQYPFLLFAGLRLVAALAILWQTWRLFEYRRFWTLATAALVMAWSNPFPFLLGRPAVYETAIIAGQAFTFVGLSLCLAALTAERRLRPWALTGAGVLWALALGSRLALLPALGFMALLTAGVFASKLADTWRNGFRLAATALGVPMAIALLALGWFNWLRFGNPLESGQYYQLGTVTLTPLFNPGYAATNGFFYLFQPLHFLGHFPFVLPVESAPTGLPWFVPSPPKPYWFQEPVAGLIWATPLLLFLYPAYRHLWTRKAQLLQALLGREHLPEKELALPWLIGAGVGFSLLALLPLLCFWMVTMRYLADFTSILLLLSCLGIFIAAEQLPAQGKAGRIFTGLTILLAAYTIVVGCLLWVESDGGFLRTHNPALLQRLTQFFS